MEHNQASLNVATITIDVLVCGGCNELHLTWDVSDPEAIPPMHLMGVLETVKADVYALCLHPGVPIVVDEDNTDQSPE